MKPGVQRQRNSGRRTRGKAEPVERVTEVDDLPANQYFRRPSSGAAWRWGERPGVPLPLHGLYSAAPFRRSTHSVHQGSTDAH